MNKWILPLVLMGTVLSAPVAADETAPVQLDQALSYALVHRLEMKRAELGVAGAEAGIREKQGLYLPTLDATASLYWQQTNDNFTGIEINGEVNGAPVSVQIDRTLPRYQGTTGLEAKWNLYAGGAHKAQIEQAKADLGKAEAEQLKAQRKVALEAAQGLIRWRQARVAQDLAEQRLAVAKKSMQISKVQHAGGAKSDVELQRAELAAKREEINLKKAQREHAQAWRDYLKAINHPVVRVPEHVAQDLSDACIVLDRWFPPAVDPDVKIAQSEVEARRQKLEQSKASFRPEVNLLARHNTFDRANRDFTDALDNFSTSESLIGVQMKWNFYSGLRDRHRNEQEAIRLEQAKYDELLQQKNWQNRQQALADRLQSSRDDLKLAQRELKLQQAMQKIRGTEYKHGELSELEQLKTGLDTAQTESDLKMRELDVTLAEIQYKLGVVNSDAQ
jgi:outer membrane protein TolC